jgi:restriction endonuclease S subunit
MKTGIVNIKYALSHKTRFEGKFYLNENAFNSMLIERHQDSCLRLEQLADAFNPPVFKRQFCKKEGHSVAYYQSSDIATLLPSNVYIYKGQADKLNLLVKSGDILIAGFGTVIGDTCIATGMHEGACFANNVCRVRTFPDVKKGYLAAVLKSKYGKSMLNNNASGTAIRYIEAPRIKELLIPNFPDDFQKEVDDLIQKSASLREEAAFALEEAKDRLRDWINVEFEKHNYQTAVVSSKNIWSSLQHRIDPPAIMNDGVKTMEVVTSRMDCTTIGKIDGKVFRPGIFKRSYVDNGIPYIKGSEIFLTNPFRRCDHLSRTRTPFIEEMSMKEGQILITCAGSVGDIKLITKEYEEKESIGSQDIIRLESTDGLYTKEYLFVYLQLPFVYDYIQSMKYGSVIERIEPFHVESIPVVKPTKEISDEITSLIQHYMDFTYRAFIAEEQAITMVEQEIEKWNN